MPPSICFHCPIHTWHPTPDPTPCFQDLFLKELYRLHCLTPESLLTVHIQAGLAALKTPLSYLPGCSKEDPLHLPAFKKLGMMP